MLSTIESNVMVNPLNDSSNFKRIDADNATSGQNKDESIQQLKELISKAPEVNKTCVEFLKEELASGRYRIASDQIAARMFADVELA